MVTNFKEKRLFFITELSSGVIKILEEEFGSSEELVKIFLKLEDKIKYQKNIDSLLKKEQKKYEILYLSHFPFTFAQYAKNPKSYSVQKMLNFYKDNIICSLKNLIDHRKIYDYYICITDEEWFIEIVVEHK